MDLIQTVTKRSVLAHYCFEHTPLHSMAALCHWFSNYLHCITKTSRLSLTLCTFFVLAACSSSDSDERAAESVLINEQPSTTVSAESISPSSNENTSGTSDENALVTASDNENMAVENEATGVMASDNDTSTTNDDMNSVAITVNDTAENITEEIPQSGALETSDEILSDGTVSDLEIAGTEATDTVAANDTADTTDLTDTTDTVVGENGSTGELPISSDTVADSVLGPLPSPALTRAPSSIDEPVNITHGFNTVTEIFLVRDPGPKLPRDNSEDISEEEFAAGPLPAVTTIPDHVDPTRNSAPYFVDLEDVVGFAGEEIRILLEPEDDDGGVAGMFTESRPSGARVIDNFDTTKTLIWRPLQPDVGIHDFGVTAIDPEEPFYRTKRIVRIKVLLPEDTSSIENFAPGLNGIRDHSVRVNDPVSVEISVTDPNGTIPTLEILNPPEGAILEPHDTEPTFSVLRFIPSETGVLNIKALARDIDNPQSTAERTITINVEEPDSFALPGQRLRDLASQRDFLFGYASFKDFYERPDGALYADIAADEFNFVTHENALKWVFVNPLPGRYRWASADNVVNFAKANNMRIHGHTLVWYQALPGWVKETPVSEREGHMREFITRVLERYREDITVWDVVNEAFEDDGRYRNSHWFEAMGESHIDIAFHQARESAPDATLLYNEYDVSWFGPKADAMFTMLEEQLDRGTPIDGVGFQMHLEADFDLYDEVEVNFQKAADLDLDIYITEFDVSMVEGATFEDQAEIYGRVLDICLRQPRCKAFQTWGFSDMYSWRDDRRPLFLDERYRAKPAYLELQRRLAQ